MGTREFHRPSERVATDTSAKAAARADGHTSRETITVLEANLDDLSPQVIAYAAEKLLSGRRARRIQYSGADEEGTRRVVARLSCANQKMRDRLTETAFSPRRLPSACVAARSSGRTLARRWDSVKTIMGRCAHKDRQHEWRHL